MDGGFVVGGLLERSLGAANVGCYAEVAAVRHNVEGESQMPKRDRIPKSMERHLSDLDHHLFIVREQLHHLGESEARLKVLAVELRSRPFSTSYFSGIIALH